MIRTYVDAGVLIAASRGTNPVAMEALNILDDPNREFSSSIFTKLEVLPRVIYNKNTHEVEFYEIFFNSVTHWANSIEAIAKEAYHEACHSGLAAMEALHVAAAISTGAEELVTTEKPDKPICRVGSIKVVSIWFSIK
jgi:predicted nucleic acid-binding protein